MGGSAHHSDLFEEETSQMEEDDAGRCREHDPIRSGCSECSHPGLDRPPCTSISQSTNPAPGAGYPPQPPGNQEHKAVTVGQVVKVISQLGERKGATMNQIRNALSKDNRDMERPPCCCVKRALVRGIQAGHLERTGTAVGTTSRFMLPRGRKTRQVQYRLPKQDSSGRSKSAGASKAQKVTRRKKAVGKKCSKGKGKGKRKGKGKGKGKTKDKKKGGWGKAKAKKGGKKKSSGKGKKPVDRRSSNQKVRERKGSRKGKSKTSLSRQAQMSQRRSSVEA